MRYLIIDTEAKGNIIGSEFQSEFEIDGRVLSEEESLSIFKYLWNAARVYGIEEARGMSDQNDDFDEYLKENL